MLTKSDEHYPFEFDVHLNNPKEKLEFRLKAVAVTGMESVSKNYFFK